MGRHLARRARASLPDRPQAGTQRPRGRTRPRSPHAVECKNDRPHRRLDVMQHHVGSHPHDPVPLPLEPTLPPPIGTDPLGVIAPIHLDDEPRLGREKIDDVRPQRHLPHEPHPQPLPPDRSPQHLL